MNVWEKSPFPPEQPESSDAAGGDGDDPPGLPAPTPPGDEPTPWWKQRIAAVPAWLLLVLALVIWGGVIVALLASRGSDDPDTLADDLSAVASVETTPTTIDPSLAVVSNPPTSDEVAPATTEPATTSAATTVAPTTEPATTAPATTAPATTDSPETTASGSSSPASTEPPATSAPPTTDASTTTTTTTSTTEPTTTTTSTTTTTVPATTTTTTSVPATTTTTTPAATATTQPPQIVISGPSTVTGPNGETLTVTPRRDECRYGPECFVASFTIDGFARQPTEFVCEFSSGARYVFRFGSSAVDPACSTLDVPDSVVLIVGGLRSYPVTIGFDG